MEVGYHLLVTQKGRRTALCRLVIGTRSRRAVSQLGEPGTKVSRCDGQEGGIFEGVIGRVCAAVLVFHEAAERREVHLIFLRVAQRHVDWMLVGFLCGGGRVVLQLARLPVWKMLFESRSFGCKAFWGKQLNVQRNF